MLLGTMGQHQLVSGSTGLVTFWFKKFQLAYAILVSTRESVDI